MKKIDVIEKGPDGRPTITKARPLLQSATLPAPERDEIPPPRDLGPLLQVGAGPVDLDVKTILEDGTPAERAALAEKIRDRLRARPRVEFWKCDNPKCGKVFRVGPDYSGGACIICNWQSLKKGGHNHPLTAKEIKKHLADEKEREARQIEQIKKNKAAQDRLFNMRSASGDYYDPADRTGR